MDVDDGIKELIAFEQITILAPSDIVIVLVSDVKDVDGVIKELTASGQITPAVLSRSQL